MWIDADSVKRKKIIKSKGRQKQMKWLAGFKLSVVQEISAIYWQSSLSGYCKQYSVFNQMRGWEQSDSEHV